MQQEQSQGQMVYSEGYRLLYEATPHTIPKHPDHPFYLPIGFTVTNGDVVVDDTQLLAELCKAAHKLGTVICPDVTWLAPVGNQIIIQELSCPPAI